MSLMFLLAAGCALSASVAIAAIVVWYLYSRNKPTEDGDEGGDVADPIAARGPVVVLPHADDISESPMIAPARPAPQPVIIAPQASPMYAPPPAPPPAHAGPSPMGGPSAAPRPSAQAMPKPNVAPLGRNIVERAAPAPAAPPPAPVQVARPPPPQTVPPPAPRPPPGVPAGVTIVPNDLTPFGMQSQPRVPPSEPG